MKTVNGIDIGSLLVVEAEIPPGCHIETHEPSEPFLVPAELRTCRRGDDRAGSLPSDGGQAVRLEPSGAADLSGAGC
jgi:hypothetical protein